ncbi:penicillin-binding protein 1C [Leptospira idonii]|uniref:peptidoglycan glycosyltransferase n=1 Tax=Leptospira idonii TaxID=1193500 RepID=A0A4R9LYK4_9LEPT|nr:penicillin-binding protein 1C [Leptospira idonii]TGN19454.1 penicillin-binding protein 1C [Leptospira idonii]
MGKRCTKGILFVFLFFAFPIQSVPLFEEVKNNYLPSDLLLYDRQGEELQSVRIHPRYRSERWTETNEIPEHTLNAILFSEDKKFFEHKGIDSLAFLGSVWGKLWGLPLRGGSTITMQLVSLWEKDLKPEGGRRSFTQKLKQIQRASDWEDVWTKEQILTAYLNLVYFRGELRGIRSASWGLFRKPPSTLTPNESYLLAVLIRSPESRVEKIVERACVLKQQMENRETCDGLDTIVKQSLLRSFDYPAKPNFAPQFASKAFAEGISSESKSSLSRSLQEKVESILKSNLIPLASQNVKDGAVLVLHNSTGEVLVYVANAGNRSEVSSLDLIQARRQAGSTLKPFVYAQSFEERKLTSVSVLNDSPVDIPVFRGIYRPLNYDKSFQGKVTVTQSLGSSLNIPAVRTLSYLDMGKFIHTLSSLGLKNLSYPEFYGPSLALGTADVSLWDLTNAYRVLANGGVYTEPSFLVSPSSGKGDVSADKTNKRIFRESVSYLITRILSDREARSLSFGWENNLSTRYFSAVKTGTSQDMRDNWCLGYSEEYTVGVWVGNPTGTPMKDVSGVSGAGPVWREVMDLLHEETPSKEPSVPESVVYVPAKRAYFERGTEDVSDAGEIVSKQKTLPKITSPSHQTIFAVDPDIPVGKQKVFFLLNRYQPGYFWYLNGKKISEANSPFFWDLQKGIFQLQIADQTGKVFDEVSFEVR